LLGGSARTPTVLVVHAHAACIRAIETMLAPSDYQLKFAGTGSEALALLTSSRFDLVVSHVHVPGVDGFEVCRAIKEHPDWRPLVAVILIAGPRSDEDQIRGFEAGADDVLTPPIDPGVLRARVRARLRGREGRADHKAPAPHTDASLQERRERLVAAAGLTRREREVLDLLLLGRTHEDVSLVLGISERTSKFHQTNLLRKLGAESRIDLVRLFA
jgi:DNA-binding NarL/FixJ family response regulator